MEKQKQSLKEQKILISVRVDPTVFTDVVDEDAHYYAGHLAETTDMKEAIRHYEIAANEGHAAAMSRLAAIYFMGDELGIEGGSDYEKGKHWATKSAEKCDIYDYDEDKIIARSAAKREAEKHEKFRDDFWNEMGWKVDGIPLKREEAYWKMVDVRVLRSPNWRTPIQETEPYYILGDGPKYQEFKDGIYYGEYAACLQHHDLLRQDTGESMWFSFGKTQGEEEIRREARKELISRIMEVPELKDKYTEEFMDTDDAWFDVTINLDRDKIRAERNKKKGEADEK